MVDTERPAFQSSQIASLVRGGGLAVDVVPSGGQRLDARPILGRGLYRSRKAGSCQMKAPGALLFFHAMFRDPEPFGRQVDHLPSLRQVCGLGAQIVVALLAADDRMNEHLIGRLHLPEVMPTMALLPARRLPALFPQALGGTHKPIGGGRQTAIMAIFGLLPFEAFDAFSQRVDQPFKGFDALLLSVNGSDGLFEPFAQVLIRLVRLFQLFVFAPQPFAQDCFLGPELFQFFILLHTATVADYAMILQLHDLTEWLPLFCYYRAPNSLRDSMQLWH